MKFISWPVGLGSSFISFIMLWVVIERITYSVPDSRFQMVGYLIAGILALIGIVGIALGIRIMKKRQILASVLVGFFFTWVVIAIIVFIFGP